jgi:hypothetical protein
MAEPLPDKLEKLLEKERQLKARIQKERARLNVTERKRDTRRKVLAGAAVLSRVEDGRWPRERFLQMMDEFLDRDHDRALFDLPPKQDDAKEDHELTAGGSTRGYVSS